MFFTAPPIHVGSNVPAIVVAPPRWHRWIASSSLPIPTRIVVKGGHGGGDAIMESFPGRIVVHRPAEVTRATALHEVGHLFDFEYMGPADEQAFERQVLDGTGDWFDSDEGAFGTPYVEEFAEIYSALAQNPRATRMEQLNNEGYIVRWLTPRKIRRARTLIRRFAASRGTWHA